MKCRFDFVTNSSSASFIIAVRDDCTEEQVRAIIANYTGDIVSEIEREKEYRQEYGTNPYSPRFASTDLEEIEGEEVDDDLSIKTVTRDLITSVFSDVRGHGMRLDNWRVLTVYGSNEGEVSSSILYEHFHSIDTENFKIDGGDY